MARPASQHPTESELAILKVLWRTGSATVRTVRDALAAPPAESPGGDISGSASPREAEPTTPAAARGPEFPNSAAARGPEFPNSAAARGPEFPNSASARGPEFPNSAAAKGPEFPNPAAARGPEFPALTTVTTMLNIMVDKGYLERVKEGPRFEYRPLVSAEENSARMVTDLVSRVFDGSPAALVLNLLERDELDPAELQTLRALIDRKVREGTDRKP